MLAQVCDLCRLVYSPPGGMVSMQLIKNKIASLLCSPAGRL